MLIAIWFHRGATDPFAPPSWYFRDASIADRWAMHERLAGLAVDLEVQERHPDGDSRPVGRKELTRLLLGPQMSPLDIYPQDVAVTWRREEADSPALEFDHLMASCPSPQQVRLAAFVLEQSVRYELGMAMANAQAQEMAQQARVQAQMDQIADVARRRDFGPPRRSN